MYAPVTKNRDILLAGVLGTHTKTHVAKLLVGTGIMGIIAGRRMGVKLE